MQQRLILDSQLLDIAVSRLCQQLIENHGNFQESAIIGLQPRGVFLAELVRNRLQEETGHKVDLGYLDPTFHRDDFRRREMPVKANTTKIPFIIENREVVLVDDVLYTGRTVRAALDAMIAFGRPKKVELLVLVNRKYSRELPIEPDYIGRHVNTLDSQRVLVELEAQGHKKNKIWLVDKER